MSKCQYIDICPFRVNKFHFDTVCNKSDSAKYCPYKENVAKEKLPKEWANEKVKFT
jgi:hypothetical protein